jgi:hypothetical protein
MIPITTKALGPNPITQLEEELRVWEVHISAREEKIRVLYEIITLAPNKEIVKSSGDINYYRYNSETNPAFDNWRNSPIGAGITAAIEATLTNYPNLEQSA